jgi:hypothetical protein
MKRYGPAVQVFEIEYITLYKMKCYVSDDGLHNAPHSSVWGCAWMPRSRTVER